MPWWRSALLYGYYYTTYPMRCWQGRLARRAGRAPAIVLCYHRVANDNASPWTCSQSMFARQVRWLKDHFELVALDEAQRRIGMDGHTRPCVSITFDDGYEENLQTALPLLIREHIPCTYFVTLHHVLHREPFAHDVALGLHPAPNSIEQLCELAREGIEIGAHTRTHADLGKTTDALALLDEVVTSRDELARALGRPVRWFAFPYGHVSNLPAEAFAIARQAGYQGVCSAYGGFNYPGDDAFHLQRICAGDSMIRLKNWCTVDPRKKRIERYSPATVSGTLHPQRVHVA